MAEWENAPVIDDEEGGGATPEWQNAPVVEGGDGTSLVAPEETPTRYRVGKYGQRYERPPTYSERLQDLDLPTDAEGGGTRSRLAASAGSIEDVRRNLAQEFDVDPEVLDIANLEGAGIVFRNPESGEYEPLNPPGMDLNDLLVGASELPVLAGEVAGGAIGLRGGPQGVAAGAGTGAAAGRTGQKAVLDALGITDPSPGEYATDAAVEGAIAAGGAAIPSLGAAGRRLLSPRLRAAEGMRRAGVTSEQVSEGREALRPLSEETGAEFSPGQEITEVAPETGARVRAMETDQPELSGEARRQASQREAAQRVEREAAPAQPVDQEQVGADISRVAGEQVEDMEARIVQSTQKEIDRFQQKIDNAIQGRDVTQAGGNIRETFQQGRNRVFNTISEGYRQLWREAGNPQADMAGIRDTGQKWRDRIDEDLFPSLTPEDRSLVNDALNAGLKETEEGEAIDVGSDLSSVSRALSLLKSERRKLATGRTDASIKQKPLLDDLITDLEMAREQALKDVDPQLAQAIRDQDAQWREASEMIDEALVGNILEKRSASEYKVSDSDILHNMIRNDANLRDYLRVAEKYPELNARDELKRAMLGKYRQEVIDGNKAHKTFMSNHERQLNRLFSDAEKKKLQNADQWQKQIAQSQKNEDRLLQDLRQSFDYKLSNYDPEEVTRVTRNKPSRAREVKRILKNDPDKWRNFQEVRKQQIIEEGIPESALKGDGRRELEVIAGENYVKKLDQLRELQRKQAETGGRPIRSQNFDNPDSLFGFVRRQISGPLSHAGFRVRTLGRFTGDATTRAMVELLSDSRQLENVLRANEMAASDRRYWSLLSALGVSLSDIEPTAEKQMEQVKDLMPTNE